MAGAVFTALDPTVASALRAERRTREKDAAGKLSLLRRLQQKYITGVLPQYPESRVEQSWNEQIFARILGYQTLLSHDSLPFHLLPKDRLGVRYNDFSLGFFGQSSDTIVASAELKDVAFDLDRPQHGSGYLGKTAVEQAFDAARQAHGCRFVLVSNYVELRLYRIADHRLPIAVARLDRVEDLTDLALLQAHFDRAALLGESRREADMTVASSLGADHPAMPVAPVQGFYRLVCTFTPDRELEYAIFEVEEFLRSRVLEVPNWHFFIPKPDYGRPLQLRVQYRDGWAAIDGTPSRGGGTPTRIAMGRHGQVRVSVLLRPGQTGVNGSGWNVEPDDLLSALLFHADVVKAIFDGKRLLDCSGRLHAELHEVGQSSLIVQEKGWIRAHAPNAGVCAEQRVETSDHVWINKQLDRGQAVARLLCDLAANYRTNHGGVGLDPEAIAKHLGERAGPPMPRTV